MILLCGFAKGRKGLMEETLGQVSEACVFGTNKPQVSASVPYTNLFVVCILAS